MKITISCSNRLKFNRISENEYIADHGYTLAACSGLYYLSKDGHRVSWVGGFGSVDCAEKFLNSHDYINATADSLAYTPDDFEFIVDNFNFEAEGDVWIAHEGPYTLMLTPQGDTLTLTVEDGVDTEVTIFDNISDLIVELESYYGEDIFESTNIDGKFVRVCAASGKNNRKTARDLSSNLVRVKSSNLWSYGINIKDEKSGVGDVVIQFKGRQGGPGDVYIYYDVPVKLWRKFITAPSHGHFFWKNIRNNFYYSKLTGNRRGVLKNAINR